MSGTGLGSPRLSFADRSLFAEQIAADAFWLLQATRRFLPRVGVSFYEDGGSYSRHCHRVSICTRASSSDVSYASAVRFASSCHMVLCRAAIVAALSTKSMVTHAGNLAIENNHVGLESSAGAMRRICTYLIDLVRFSSRVGPFNELQTWGCVPSHMLVRNWHLQLLHTVSCFKVRSVKSYLSLTVIQNNVQGVMP